MINRTDNDFTQIEIMKHLKVTEDMLIYLASMLSGKEREAQITTLPDLGLSHNIIRMRGGFFTGMYAQWKTDIPFIPIDATINSCRVSIYKMKDTIDNGIQFSKLVMDAKEKMERKGYSWNFGEGNHFIIYGIMDQKVPCLVLHSSAKEYKNGTSSKNLYPITGCWYENEIQVLPWTNNRYLRYIKGKSAEKFYSIYKKAERHSINRHQECAEYILNNLYLEELLNIQHYGMPDLSSVAIGCSWDTIEYVLLTAPKKSFYIVENCRKGLSPHGFGVQSINMDMSISYSEDNIRIDEVDYVNGQISKDRIEIRCKNDDETKILQKVKGIASAFNGTIRHTIKPIYTYQ